MKRSIGTFAFFMMLFGALLISNNAHAQGKVVKSKSGFIIFNNLKMSSSDQKALFSMLKSSSSSYKLSVSGSRGTKNYGRLSSSIVSRSAKESGITLAATSTCTTKSTSNECDYVNTTVDPAKLNGRTREQINSLVSKYMR